MSQPFDQRIFEEFFSKHCVKAEVYLKSGKTKSANYDSFTKTGFVETYMNPIFVDIILKTIVSNSLIIRELGLTQTGAVQIIIKEEDTSALKAAEKIVINDIQYTPYLEALGNRFQDAKISWIGYDKLILFRLVK